jgi:hypothetical protein
VGRIIVREALAVVLVVLAAVAIVWLVGQL